MWTPNLDQLVPENDSSNFAISAWHELFDPFTPDTFQPRIHNIPSLVRELQDLATRLCRSPEDTRWRQHIQFVKEECRSLVEEEQELLREMPEYDWLLKKLLADDRPQSIRLNALILQNQQSAFEGKIFQRLEKTTKNLPKKCIAFHKALRAVATLALQRGKEDDDLLDGQEFDGRIAADDVVKKMKALVQESNQKYNCVFVVRGGSVRFLSQVGFKQVKRSGLPRENIQQFRCMYGDDGFHCIGICLEATSFRDANIQAVARLAKALNVFNLHANSAEMSLCPISFIRIDGSSQFRVFNQEEPAYRRLRRRGRVEEDTEESLNLFSEVNVDERVLNALELHSTALASSEPRVRLINFWSALECLSACCEGRSVIERVCQLVTPIIVWRRPDKLVRYLSIETKKFADVTSSSNFGSGFERSRRDFVHPWDLMETLSKPEGHEHLKQYSTFVHRHPYLRYRATVLWKMLCDPKQLLKSWEGSANRVQWQLYRIYRARNILIHQGQETPFFIALLDNLMFYTSVVISRVIHGLKVDKSWGVREAWEYWKLKSEFVMESLQKNPNILTVGDFFPRVYESDVSPLWPNSRVDHSLQNESL